MKQGEKVYRLRANRVTKCGECQGYIYPGQTFLLDKIPYPRVGPFGRVSMKVHNHILHEGHWKESKGVIIDLSSKPKKPRRLRNY